MRSAVSPVLSNGQILCLELVAQNLTSKEIAVRLGISHHTVDQRVRRALRVLGADNRRQAVRIFRKRWQNGKRADLRHAPIDPAPPPASAAAIAVRASGSANGLRLPFATASWPTNEMTLAERIAWILGISVAAFFAGFMYLAGLESLARLLSH